MAGTPAQLGDWHWALLLALALPGASRCFALFLVLVVLGDWWCAALFQVLVALGAPMALVSLGILIFLVFLLTLGWSVLTHPFACLHVRANYLTGVYIDQLGPMLLSAALCGLLAQWPKSQFWPAVALEVSHQADLVLPYWYPDGGIVITASMSIEK